MPLYPAIEPYAHGWLNAGDGQRIYWEPCGNPAGKPAVVLHGGPGSGCTPGWRHYFDPEAYRIVLFDQRGYGRSIPHASNLAVDLATNTTARLIADIELLRQYLEIDRWLVFGASWGSTLGLAYAENFPERVSEIVLFSIVTTTPREVEWVKRDMGRLCPAEWARFRDGVPASARDGSLAAAYSQILEGPDPIAREQAAIDWCAWEDTHVSLVPGSWHDPRYEDTRCRMAFARLGTHYWSHAAWLEDGALLREAHKLAGISGVLVQGRLDVSGPPDIAWHLAQAWPDAEFILIDDAGHGAGDTGMTDVLVAATDRFARS
jgi:proline iminopeptidase